MLGASVGLTLILAATAAHAGILDSVAQNLMLQAAIKARAACDGSVGSLSECMSEYMIKESKLTDERIRTMFPNDDPDAIRAYYEFLAMRLNPPKESSTATPPPKSEEVAPKPIEHYRDPGAKNLCPPPYRMTEWDGCQPARR
jgi:hypothetical protein